MLGGTPLGAGQLVPGEPRLVEQPGQLAGRGRADQAGRGRAVQELGWRVGLGPVRTGRGQAPLHGQVAGDDRGPGIVQSGQRALPGLDRGAQFGPLALGQRGVLRGQRVLIRRAVPEEQRRDGRDGGQQHEPEQRVEHRRQREVDGRRPGQVGGPCRRSGRQPGTGGGAGPQLATQWRVGHQDDRDRDQPGQQHGAQHGAQPPGGEVGRGLPPLPDQQRGQQHGQHGLQRDADAAPVVPQRPVQPRAREPAAQPDQRTSHEEPDQDGGEPGRPARLDPPLAGRSSALAGGHGMGAARPAW